VNSDPGNAVWQRDLFRSYLRMGIIAEKTGDTKAPDWWRRAYETVRQIKERGLFISPHDEDVLSQLEAKMQDMK
jgi:hypothetical protein